MLISESVSLAPHTTVGLGGPARYFGVCATEEDVREALEFSSRRGVPLQVIGGGSNVVFPDAGVAGLVARIAIGGLSFDELRDGAVRVRAGAGVPWDSVVAEAVARGLSGIECLSGIPGTVGGTPIQNVGAYGQEIAETLVAVACLDRATRRRVAFDRGACGFGYRTSRFKGPDRDRYVVLGVELRLRQEPPPVPRYAELAVALGRRGGIEGLAPRAAVALVREAVLDLRRAKAMVVDAADPNTRSVGSFFVNPVVSQDAFAEVVRRWRAGGGEGEVPAYPAANGVKLPAAWLVEHAGYRKGYQRDGVGVSARHALALVNLGGTTSALLDLAGDIERAVLDAFGVRLQREAVVL